MQLQLLNKFKRFSQIFILMLISAGKWCDWVFKNHEALNEQEMKDLAMKSEKQGVFPSKYCYE